MSRIRMDNSGDGLLQVPGFGDIPFDYELPSGSRFAHGINEWRQLPAVTARELAMVSAMSRVTDKRDWHVGIFDEDVARSWEDEAFAASPLMSEKAWGWCLTELRDKAREFNIKGYVRTLDTGSCLCKSDTLVPEACAVDLKDGLAPLFAQRVDGKQPTIGFIDVVDPSLYPLVYGKTGVSSEGGRVELDNVLGSSKPVKTAPKHRDKRSDSGKIQHWVESVDSRSWRGYNFRFDSSANFYYWSCNFQWLPCEVEIVGEHGTDVQITSYINNLHPQHRLVYKALEKVISRAIEPWNDCLIQGRDDWTKDNGRCDYFNQTQRGPVPLRIVTYGATWKNELPEWALMFDTNHRERTTAYLEAEATLRTIPAGARGKGGKKRAAANSHVLINYCMKGLDEMPEMTPESWQKAEEFLKSPERGSTASIELPKNWQRIPWRHIEQKAGRMRYLQQPEPGTAVSYEDWKSGRDNHRAVVEMLSRDLTAEWHTPSESIHRPYTVRIEEAFRKGGLQVIAKISGIELTRGSPQYAGDAWQLPGQLNEHIVATAIYVYDASNVTECRMVFRQETSIDNRLYRHTRYTSRRSQGESDSAHRYHAGRSYEGLDALAEIVGYTHSDLCSDCVRESSTLPYQEIGSESLPQGRLITFPNVMEYRHLPFELADKTTGGHIRFVTLYLVDPNYRICSTRNVPPQQHMWWSAPARQLMLRKGLPGEELVESIREHYLDWPMSAAAAAELKGEVSKEHEWTTFARCCSLSCNGF